jgi:hypothetical protein
MGAYMKPIITLVLASAGLALFASGASAQPTVSMRDGSTIVSVGGGCLVQYGARRERINNATRCSEGDLQQADRVMSGGGGQDFGGGFGGNRGFGGGGGGGAGVPSGSWAQSCRGGQMRGYVFSTECRDESGRWNATILDMRNCPSAQAENRNGSLVCR